MTKYIFASALNGLNAGDHNLASTMEVIFGLCGKGKGNAIPLQSRTGPQGSRRLRLPDLKTFGT
jgi:hypothetical protein